jgi:hypothetical protein
VIELYKRVDSPVRYKVKPFEIGGLVKVLSNKKTILSVKDVPLLFDFFKVVEKYCSDLNNEDSNRTSLGLQELIYIVNCFQRYEVSVSDNFKKLLADKLILFLNNNEDSKLKELDLYRLACSALFYSSKYEALMPLASRLIHLFVGRLKQKNATMDPAHQVRSMQFLATRCRNMGLHLDQSVYSELRAY